MIVKMQVFFFSFTYLYENPNSKTQKVLLTYDYDLIAHF